MRTITKITVSAFMSSHPFSHDNTRVSLEGSHAYLVLHGNPIARRAVLTGEIEITTAGWNTVTTRARLNGIPGVQVNSVRGRLMLNGQPWDGAWKQI